jgi:hypothetical protein
MTISPNKWELDVQGYLNTCNISDSTPRQQIRDFAKGVNDLGLWNSMVCWPLRSTQNAGTGTVAYSLGGLGTFDGTLVNGPAWGASGIEFVGASGTHIVTSLFTAATNKFLAGAVVTNDTGEGAVISNDDIASNRLWNRSNAGISSGTTAVFNPDYLPLQGSGETSGIKMVSLRFDATTVQNYKNATGATVYDSGGYTFDASARPVILGTRIFMPSGADNFSFTGTIALAFYISENVNVSQFYTVVRNTLATGLGLP